MNTIKTSILFFAVLFLFACQKPEAPSFTTYSPDFGPEGTLITVEGAALNNVTAINFNDGVPADFNPSYSADQAVLFRVPEEAPLGDNIITIETEGGSVELDFRVSLRAPVLKEYYPLSGKVGGTVTLLGFHFYEPLEVLFFDSISAPILHSSVDSLVVEIPPGVQKGFIKIKANGGNISTNAPFFTTNEYLINDFDGNGLRSETNRWIFRGFCNETTATTVRNSDPDPIDGNFIKLSGTDPSPGPDVNWIGGIENHANFPGDPFDVFPLQSDLNNSFVEFDLNGNGTEHTYVIVVLGERDGSPNDFTNTIKIEWDGWEKVSIPLNRFKDLNNLTIDPQKVKVIKFHLTNNDNVNSELEANIDNVKLIQIN